MSNEPMVGNAHWDRAVFIYSNELITLGSESVVKRVLSFRIFHFIHKIRRSIASKDCYRCVGVCV